MGKIPPKALGAATDYSELPERIPLDETVTMQETREVPDPTMGRDTETEFMLRNAAG